jgi:hypothetical protein
MVSISTFGTPATYEVNGRQWGFSSDFYEPSTGFRRSSPHFPALLFWSTLNGFNAITFYFQT